MENQSLIPTAFPISLFHPSSAWFLAIAPQFPNGNLSCDSDFGKRQNEPKVRMPLLLVTGVCLEKPLGLSFAGSGSGCGVGGLGFVLGAHPFFQSVHHLGRSGAVVASPPGPARHPHTPSLPPASQRAGICVNGGSGASLCVQRVRNPRGRCPRRRTSAPNFWIFPFFSDVEL